MVNLQDHDLFHLTSSIKVLYTIFHIIAIVLQKELISLSNIPIKGILSIPDQARCLILFVHGSGSNRFSSRNSYLSELFQNNGFATLLIDLLTDDEKNIDQVKKSYRFNSDLLTERVVSILQWINNDLRLAGFPIGCYSSSSGAAATIKASLQLDNIRTIVAKSGRVDFLEEKNIRIKIPILLLAGSRDKFTVEVNKKFQDRVKNTGLVKLTVIPGATHYFDEEGKLDQVFKISLGWYNNYLLNEHETLVTHTTDYFSKIRSKIDFSYKLRLRFQDRSSAGVVLARMLSVFKSDPEVIVLGIPKGGLVVADAISKKLSLRKLDFVLCTRILSPYNEEITIGSMVEDGGLYMHADPAIFNEQSIKLEIQKKQMDMSFCLFLYGAAHLPEDWKEKKIILVDDGAFTGSSIYLAYKYVSKFKPRKIVIAVPVLSIGAYKLLSQLTDDIVFIQKPFSFTNVESYYNIYKQLDKKSIIKILDNRYRYNCM